MRSLLRSHHSSYHTVLFIVLTLFSFYAWSRQVVHEPRHPVLGNQPQDFFGFNLPRVRHYYLFMCNRVSTPVPRGYSLARFLGDLFAETYTRSRKGDAVRENRDATLAMVMLLGESYMERFNRLVIGEQTRKCARLYHNVVLGGRRDLKKHFIFSAGIKLLSDSSLSYAIGEIKEFLDIIKPKATGFSFVDLAANLAGLRFVETAVDSEKGARWAQKMLAGNINESVFFPDTRSLK